MAITTLNVKDIYTGDGITTVFTFTFDVWIDPNSNTDQLVENLSDYVDVYFVVNGVSVLQPSSSYVLVGPGGSPPSTVTFNVAPAAGVVITVARAFPITQTSRFRPQQPLDASVTEESFDLLTMICQQLQDELDRTVQIDISNNPSMPIIFPAPLANAYIAWDPTGTFLVDAAAPVFTSVGGATWPFRVVFDVLDPSSQGFAPTHYGLTGTAWAVNDTCWNTACAPGGNQSWVCTVAGVPGTAVFEQSGAISRTP